MAYGLNKMMADMPKGGKKNPPIKPAESGSNMSPKGVLDPNKEGGRDDNQGTPMEVHDHGDGSFHTVKDGQEEQHPDLLHMTTHVAHAHEPESKHHHSKHDGFSGHTHGVHEDGTHEETQEHDSGDSMGEGLKAFMGGEEGQEDKPQHEDEQAPLGGM
jgi:hypothetical protein